MAGGDMEADVLPDFAHVAAELKKHLNNATHSFYEDVVGFYHAVDFREPWLQLILLLHVICFGVVVATRNRMNAQTVLFCVLLFAAYSAEWLNSLGARHWKAFATQNYFDHHGVFISAVWSAPFLVNAFSLIVLALRTSASLLVKVKRAEFAREARAKKKAQ